MTDGKPETAEPMTWHPIETAPENHTPILVAATKGGCDCGWIGIGAREFITEGDVDGWHWSEVMVRPLQFVPPMTLDGTAGCERSAPTKPTHWMSLPDLPHD